MGAEQSSSAKWVEASSAQRSRPPADTVYSQPAPQYQQQPVLTSPQSNRPMQIDRNTSVNFHAIKDNFSSIQQVQRALRDYGLESSELIVGIDFTKSNEWQGETTFGGRNLHDISTGSNPYLEAFGIVSRTLEAFDDDRRIPCYGFGDATTHADSVFSFYLGDRPCNGLADAVQRYQQLLPHINMSGPTSFGPIIRQAMRVVKASGNRFHILLLIADGAITRSIDLAPNQLSPFERDTMDAIVAASDLPLSIVMVGVGDGPWDAMKEFDDRLPNRRFDNFQFVDFHRIMTNLAPEARDAQFALRALMEVPEQYATIVAQKLLDPSAGANIRVEAISGPKKPPISEDQLKPATAPPIPAVQQTAKAESGGPDDLFLCPITQDVMKDPVIAGDGYTYDREAIQSWFQQHATSPMTNQVLDTKALIPNNVLRSRIRELYPDLGK